MTPLRANSKEARRIITQYMHGKRRSKFGVRLDAAGVKLRTTPDGITHASQKQARRWVELLALQKAGKISGLRREVRFRLEVNGHLIAHYVCDHLYAEGGTDCWEDVKSSVTRALSVYRMKKKLMLAIHNIEIREV